VTVHLIKCRAKAQPRAQSPSASYRWFLFYECGRPCCRLRSYPAPVWRGFRSGANASSGDTLEFHTERVPLSPTYLHQILLFKIKGCILAPHSRLILNHFFVDPETKFGWKIGARAQHQLCPGARNVLHQAADAKFAPAKADASRSEDWKARFLPAFLHLHSSEPSTASRRLRGSERAGAAYMNCTPMRCTVCQTTLQ
jgi:hypothetical protein